MTVEKRCTECNRLLGDNDNFCYYCGHWTSHGYKYFKDKRNRNVLMGSALKQSNRVNFLIILFLCSTILFLICINIRGLNLFKPFAYLKKEIISYRYGYNSSLIKSDHIYNNRKIVSDLDAVNSIIYDSDSQDWLCSYDKRVIDIERGLERDYGILSVSFCDISYEEALKIESVIRGSLDLFPNSYGYLTNITLSNSKEMGNFVAYFQPIYRFINGSSDVSKYNRVNKTQILLNSYYFLNVDKTRGIIDDKYNSGYYVSGGSMESLVAHEIGHYISFVTLLRSKGIDNVRFEEGNRLDEVYGLVNSGEYSKGIVEEALSDSSMDKECKSISQYACQSVNGNFVYDELIAEAVHDFYVNRANATDISKKIVDILRSRL